jgi:lipoyl(octanoyl) transferase
MAGGWPVADAGPADIVGRVSDELVYVHLGLGEQPVPYLRGWEPQRQIHGQRVNDEIPDTCLPLQHEPVFIAGKRTSPLDRPLGDAGAPVVEVDRGGKITWPGPGQLVGYPIIRLGEPVDVIAYVRAIEEALMRPCARVLGAARWRRAAMSPTPV